MQKQRTVKKTSDEFAQCVRLAEKKNDTSFVIKVNGLKRKSNEVKEGIVSLEGAIVELKNKKWSL